MMLSRMSLNQPILIIIRDTRECEQVVAEHLQFMVTNGIDVQDEHKALPLFYWLPKLHKQPYGKRFIAASNKCSTKSLSKLLTACLAMSILKNTAMAFTQIQA